VTHERLERIGGGRNLFIYLFIYIKVQLQNTIQYIFKVNNDNSESCSNCNPMNAVHSADIIMVNQNKYQQRDSQILTYNISIPNLNLGSHGRVSI
jgi:hypothetical protein